METMIREQQLIPWHKKKKIVRTNVFDKEKFLL